MANKEIYDLFAIKYARHERDARDNFVDDPDPHHGPMPIDYFVWVAKSKSRTVVIDTGFDQRAADERKRQLIRCPIESLKLVGVDPKKVTDVIITHMHYDHAGNVEKLPNATFHLQDMEMSYATGRHMLQPVFRKAYDIEYIVSMVRQVYAERVKFHAGDVELFPGIGLHFIGGHTLGLQSVTVETKRGRVVVASDAAHLYANILEAKPYPTVFNIGDMMEGHQKLFGLAGGNEDLIVPGHDPLVLDYYPPVSAKLKGIVIRLDVAPKKPKAAKSKKPAKAKKK
ncbi:MAG: N-acyl homoserine lactonase family protein [Proteobacteria bacterium]|nr:N-acyl homoserine lactonase family protein [Pseudomonadota bacterium]